MDCWHSFPLFLGSGADFDGRCREIVIETLVRHLKDIAEDTQLTASCSSDLGNTCKMTEVWPKSLFDHLKGRRLVHDVKQLKVAADQLCSGLP